MLFKVIGGLSLIGLSLIGMAIAALRNLKRNS